MSRDSVFVPHAACTVASGACFVDGKCIGRCTTQLSVRKANRELTEALHLLRQLRDYTIMFRDVTRYVDGSTIGAAVTQASKLLERNPL